MRALLLVLVLAATPALSAPLTGRATVVDGDTLDIRGTCIRLHGVDAPESGQTCKDATGKAYRRGQAAANALAGRIGAAPVSCEPRQTDRYGRTVAVCRSRGEDLNAWLVAQGHAIAYRTYSSDYVGQEVQAKAAKRGIWAGSIDEPSAWRRGRRAAGVETRPEAVPAGGCRIKGNVSRNGERVYHVPGGRDYERTRVSARSGERWFCSEAEARTAGWRAAR